MSFFDGESQGEKAGDVCKGLLEEVGISGERVAMYNLSAAEGARFAEIAREMTDRIKGLGPSPIRTKEGRELREEGEEEQEQVSSKQQGSESKQ